MRATSAAVYSRYPAAVRSLGPASPISSQWCSVRTVTPTREATAPTVLAPLFIDPRYPRVGVGSVAAWSESQRQVRATPFNRSVRFSSAGPQHLGSAAWSPGRSGRDGVGAGGPRRGVGGGRTFPRPLLAWLARPKRDRKPVLQSMPTIRYALAVLNPFATRARYAVRSFRSFLGTGALPRPWVGRAGCRPKRGKVFTHVVIVEPHAA